MGKLINIDNGGTLTDFCAFDGERLLFTKTLTTPHDLGSCFFEGLERLSAQAYGERDVARLLQETDHIRYSTTQGTNALVERRGPRLGLITASEMARHSVRAASAQGALFDALIGERHALIDITASDAVLDAAITRAINELGARGANRVVVSLDGADAESVERRLQRIVLRRFPSHLLGALPVAFAAEMSRDPDYGRRTWTALFNAFLHPAMERFLYGAEHRLKQHRTRNPLLIFRNDGGSARVAKTIALKTYSSGPRGGMEGARALARHYALDELLCIDVGGTTTDVGVVSGGEVHEDHHGEVEGVAISLPLCRVYSAGVGGSSIIRVADGALLVGPQSVGAAPGPACFARGGTALTMTDVALLCGLIDPRSYFGGELALDAARAASALALHVAEPLALSSDAALAAAEAAWQASIVAAVRAFAPPRPDTLLAGFGGGGPLLLTAIATALGLRRAMIPGMASVFSAFGIGFSDLSQSYQRHLADGDGETLRATRRELLARAQRDMFAEGSSLESCQLAWSVRSLAAPDHALPWQDEDAPPALPAPLLLRLDVVKPIARQSLRAIGAESATAAVPRGTRTLLTAGARRSLPLYVYADLTPGAYGVGPCVVEEDYFTARIDAGWRFDMSGNGDLLLTRDASDAARP